MSLLTHLRSRLSRSHWSWGRGDYQRVNLCQQWCNWRRHHSFFSLPSPSSALNRVWCTCIHLMLRFWKLPRAICVWTWDLQSIVIECSNHFQAFQVIVYHTNLGTFYKLACVFFHILGIPYYQSLYGVLEFARVNSLINRETLLECWMELKSFLPPPVVFLEFELTTEMSHCFRNSPCQKLIVANQSWHNVNVIQTSLSNFSRKLWVNHECEEITPFCLVFSNNSTGSKILDIWPTISDYISYWIIAEVS